VEVAAANLEIEAAELQDLARSVIRKTTDRRAAYSGSAGSELALRKVMADLGWMLLNTPTERGGLGQSFLAMQPIYGEIGRALAPSDLAGSMAAVDALVLTRQSSEANELLTAIGSGNAAVAVAYAGSRSIIVENRNSVAEASGNLQSVVDAVFATHLLILPERATNNPLTIVELASDGVAASSVVAWDKTRTLSDIELTGAHATVIITGPDAMAASLAVRAHLDLAVACDSLGGAVQILDETIDYMKTRRQFNRPIGSFQALKHRCADLQVGLELARALINDACLAYAIRRDGWSCRAAQAKLMATGIYHSITEEAVQLHGGIGFAWEHHCHLFLKRALLNEMLGGTPEHYKDSVASEIFARAAAGRGGASCGDTQKPR
jgi:alkylation response protein AidB-like acyl-CoA dehydrogenase